jgi:outer membrane biosynthesis protein TonB
MAGLRSTIYARMEEMSFRSGAVIAAGVLVAVGVVVALAVTLSGHSAAATSAAGAGTAVRSVAPSSLAHSPPPQSTASPSARPSAKKRTVPAQSYQAPPQQAVVTRPQASPVPAADPQHYYHRPKPAPPRSDPPIPTGGIFGWYPGNPRLG